MATINWCDGGRDLFSDSLEAAGCIQQREPAYDSLSSEYDLDLTPEEIAVRDDLANANADKQNLGMDMARLVDVEGLSERERSSRARWISN